MGCLKKFVPIAKEAPVEKIMKANQLLSEIDKLVIMTGAGLSTESGIPDYRSEKVGQYARTKHRPIQHSEFMGNEYWRRRYWSRNFVAWNRFRDAPFNLSHKILSDWENYERFSWLITQNVDGLHTKAGSKQLTELHGCARRVVCMECGEKYSRDEIQLLITELNPYWTVEEIGEIAPDGDVEIPEKALNNFRTPFCTECGEKSILKTDVIFFGDNVPQRIVEKCYEKVDDADGILVLGSSLTVMSGYRFVWYASQKQKPIIIVNIGPTRADQLATLKLDAKCSEVLQKLEFH